MEARDHTGPFLALVVSLLMITAVVPMPELGSSADAAGAPGPVIVGFTDGIPAHAVGLVESRGGELLEAYPALDAVLAHAQDTSSFIDAIRTSPGVAYAEVDHQVTAQFTPDDPLFTQQTWWLNPQGVPLAWDLSRGDPHIVVAVIDSGLDASHPDLADKLWTDPATGANGFDFVDVDTTPQDAFGHGTHVAGVAAAALNNAEGLAGVGGSVSIMPLRVMDENGTGRVSDVANAVTFAGDKGADVIVLSLGWGALPSIPSVTLENAVQGAAAQGSLLLAAAGNGGPVHTPATFPEVVAVGALQDSSDGLVPVAGASSGPELELSAPARGLNSTMSSTNTLDWCDAMAYCKMSGTSVAAAQAGGGAGLLLSCRPDLTATQAREALGRTAVDVDDGTSLTATGWDEVTGWGHMDARAAVDAVGGCDAGPAPLDPTGRGLTVPVKVTSGDWAIDSLMWRSTGPGERTISGDSAWVYNDAETLTYDDGQANSGTLYSPSYDVDAQADDVHLTFAHWADTEADQGVDTRRVLADWGGGWTEIYRPELTPQRTWVVEDIPLPSDVRGTDLRFKFTFDTVDARANDHEGWYIDNVRVYEDSGTENPLNVTTLAGSVSHGTCETHAIAIDPTQAEAFQVRLVPDDPTADLDLSLAAPSLSRTGGWTCDDHAVRNGVAGGAYSGPSATPEWIYVAPVTTEAAWTATVRGFNGGSGYTLEVTEVLATLPTLNLTYGTDILLEEPTFTYPDLRCGYDSGGSPRASSSCTTDGDRRTTETTSEDGAGKVVAESGLGYVYEFHRACSGQEVRGAVVTGPHTSQELHTDVGGLGGSAEASIRVRPSSLDAEPVRTAFSSTDPVITPTPSFEPALDTTYETVVSAYAHASTSIQGAYAEAATRNMSVSWLRLSFGDFTPPNFTATDAASADPTPAAAAGSFQGWYQEPVSFDVTAWDPYNSDDLQALSEPISCVDEVRAENLFDGSLAVQQAGFDQGPTQDSASTLEFAYTLDGYYDLDVSVVDKTGNKATDTARYTFGVDATPPVTTLRLDPATPTGNEGWYKRVTTAENDGQPTLFLDCEDNASGCQARFLEERGEVTQMTDQGILVVDGVHDYNYSSTDVATNAEPWNGPEQVKVDTVLPDVTLSPSIAPGPDPAWYSANLTVTPSCDDPGDGSGCDERTLALDGTAQPWGPTDVSGEGTHTMDATAEDVAGNLRDVTQGFNIDLQDPPATTLLSPSDGFLTNATEIGVSWSAVLDNGPAGIHHYEIAVNGTVNATSEGTSASLADLVEGNTCIKVRPVDAAGRTGPWSDEVCGKIDRTAPTVDLEIPPGSSITKFDEVKILSSMPSDEDVNLKNLTAESSAQEVGLAGLDQIELRYEAWQEVLGEQQIVDAATKSCTTASCDINLPRAGLEEGKMTVKLWITASDKAGNHRTLFHTIHEPSIDGYAVYSSGWQAHVDWMRAEDETLVQYDVHRDTQKDFIPGDATKIATITDRNTTAYRDSSALEGTKYYYIIQYTWEDGGVAETLYTYSRGIYVPSSGGGGGGGGGGGDSWDREWGDCQLPILCTKQMVVQ